MVFKQYEIGKQQLLNESWEDVLPTLPSRSVLKFESKINGTSRHPTAKPLELVTWLVKSFSNRGDVVLDTFAGSFTTIAATRITNRRGIGCEIGEDYFNNACEWLKAIDTEIRNVDE